MNVVTPMDLVLDIFEAMQQPQMRHAAVVHGPIVLSAASAVAGAALAWTGGRHAGVRWTALSVFAALAISAWLAASSGAAAHRELGSISAELRDVIDQHRAMGRYVWIMGVVGAAACGLSRFSVPRIRLVSVSVTLAVGTIGAGWTALVGHLGGTAVYRFGAGVAVVEAPASHVEPSGEVVIDPRVVQFRDRVLPVLAKKCMSCHSAGAAAAGGLDMTTMRGLLIGGGRGPAIVPGDADASLLYQAATWTHESLRMPRGGERLSDSSLSDLKEWINAGAVWHVGR